MIDAAPLPKIVYALTSKGNDSYSKLTYISASLVRRLYPNIELVLVVDELTGPRLEAVGDPICRLVDGIRIVKTSMNTAVERNRFLKTTMRSKLEGPFVYLDADTLPIRRFDAVFAHQDDIAGVNDYTEGLLGLRRSRWVKDLYASLEWQYPPRHYLNGGVLYMADREVVREFGRQWHKAWRECMERAKLSLDQPSLNRALDISGVRVRRLSENYNCQLRSTIRPVRKARIFHYFTSQKLEPGYSLLDYLVQHLDTTGTIDWPAVEHAAASGDPYTGNPPGIKASLTSGRYLNAARQLIRHRVIPRTLRPRGSAE